MFSCLEIGADKLKLSGWGRYPKHYARVETPRSEAAQDATYTVAWIDCLASGKNLGRSLVAVGEHALRSELPKSRRDNPFDYPHKRKREVPFTSPHLC